MNRAIAAVSPHSALLTSGFGLAELPSFDLSKVMARVARENPDWSPDRLQKAEDDYRVFLVRAKLSREEDRRTPERDVDEVWHNHILHTHQYVDDCSAYFGHYLHHVPPSEGTTCCL